MSSRIKIRGIYATSLTKLALDAGHTVVDPSIKLAQRFNLEQNDAPCEILVQDIEDLQGIELYGFPENICQFTTFLQEQMIDAVLMECDQAMDSEGLIKARIELPGASKETLDRVRSSVTPTLARHHRLRIVDGKAVDEAEALLLKNPESKNDVERDLFRALIALPMEKSGTVRLEHIRPSGKAMRPREGLLLDSEPVTIAFRRSFNSGRYDGLDVPIGRGDYGITTLREGAWYIKHAYYTKRGELIGEYYNVNTPVELYPYGARYMDLEVDVVRHAGERPQLLDREKLSLLSRRGCISDALEARAMEVAEELMEKIRD